MNWLSLIVALVKLATSLAEWLRARSLLVAGEAKGRASSDADHARTAAEQGARMRGIAAAPPTGAEIEKRLEEGNA
jgi:hypothetical protein